MNTPLAGVHGQVAFVPECAALRGEIVGSSPAFLAALDQMRRIARSEAPVLIEGETGSGKELAARAIHYWGLRQAGPFVPLNCGALPEHLVEAELFGHERGAFTDAKAARRGVVAEANGGTLFLDEVDALSPKAQVALLRFAQDQHYRPLGTSRERTSDVRILAATNCSLDDLVRQGAFRSDLLYRLKILHLRMPPLRERSGDAEQLAHHFIRIFGAKYKLRPKTLDAATLAWLRAHAWPGNVRELENWVHREFLMADGEAIRTVAQGAGPARASDAACGPADFARAKAEAVRLFECDYLLRALQQAEGNVTRAAQLAGKERRAFGKLLKKHGIERRAAAVPGRA